MEINQALLGLLSSGAKLRCAPSSFSAVASELDCEEGSLPSPFLFPVLPPPIDHLPIFRSFHFPLRAFFTLAEPLPNDFLSRVSSVAEVHSLPLPSALTLLCPFEAGITTHWSSLTAAESSGESLLILPHPFPPTEPHRSAFRPSLLPLPSHLTFELPTTSDVLPTYRNSSVLSRLALSALRLADQRRNSSTSTDILKDEFAALLPTIPSSIPSYHNPPSPLQRANTMSSALTTPAPAPLTSAAVAQVPSLDGETPVPSPPSSDSGRTHVESTTSSLSPKKGASEDDLEKAEMKEETAARAAAPDFPDGGARAYFAVAGATIVMATTFGMSNSLYVASASSFSSSPKLIFLSFKQRSLPSLLQDPPARRLPSIYHRMDRQRPPLHHLLQLAAIGHAL